MKVYYNIIRANNLNINKKPFVQPIRIIDTLTIPLREWHRENNTDVNRIPDSVWQ